LWLLAALARKAKNHLFSCTLNKVHQIEWSNFSIFMAYHSRYFIRFEGKLFALKSILRKTRTKNYIRYIEHNNPLKYVPLTSSPQVPKSILPHALLLNPGSRAGGSRFLKLRKQTETAPVGGRSGSGTDGDYFC